MCPSCQLNWLRLVDFGRRVCVYVSVVSVKLASAGRLWQTSVCVCPSCQLNWLRLVDFGTAKVGCVCPSCQLNWLRLVDFGRRVCVSVKLASAGRLWHCQSRVCVSVVSVKLASAGRLWQTGVCVRRVS